MKISDRLIIGVDFSDGDDWDTLVIGRQTESGAQIVNVLLGEDAREMYKKLTTVKEEK